MSKNQNLSSLPEHWKWIKLEEILLSVVGGGTPSKSNLSFWKGDIPWLTVKDMRTTRPKSTIDHISLDAVDNSSTNLLPADTIIVATRIGLGKLVRVPFPTTINQDLKGLFLSKYLNKSYMEYWYLSQASYIESIGAGTTVKGIRLEQLKSLKFPFAPQAAQKSIVKKIEELFSHIDAGVEGLKQAKSKLQQYRQSVLIGAVTGKLTEQWREQNADKLEPADKLLERILDDHRVNWEAEQLKIFEEKGKIPKDDKWKDKYKIPLPPETEDVPELPSEWGYLRLEAISAIQGGITVDAKRKPDDTTLLPYLRVANVQRGYLELSKMKDIRVPNDKVDDLLLQDGDILFNEGGDRDKLGRGWVWRNEIDKCIYQNHVFRARLYSNELVPEFVSIFGNTIGKEYFIKQGKQTTNLASINKTKLSAFPVPVCSFDEMTTIIEIVTDKVGKTERTIVDIDAQLLRATQLKNSILAKAFSGELVENIETEESAEQLLEKIQAEKQLLEEKAKLAKNKPNARTKKMEKRPIIDVLKEVGKTLKVDELFEKAGFQNDVSPESIEAFYQELKIVVEDENVEVTPIILDGKKQGDKFKYKEVKNEAG
ncbi:restriction endonuclease subunit S [Moritella viscosa]|uniref:Type I site-specific deoxyribonuclease n=1 Tax=Moritella viscosa TaxID=80854 RepID=A0A1L0AV55_9GAMM|nr:restriction endonuclease subunit S [Moritella viscosa]SGZ19746.1 Type I site-specific deoxyribonuclease [Moritella viscosa]